MASSTARGTIYFCYADPKGFSGQRAATELAIAGLTRRGWTVRRLPQPVFEREGKNLLSFVRYGFFLVLAWLRAVPLLAARGGWLCVNLGQTSTGMIRDAVPLWCGCVGLGRSRVIVSLHGSLFMRWTGGSREWRRFRRLLERAGTVNVLGETQKRRLVAMGVPRERVEVLLNSCDLEPASPASVEAKQSPAEESRPVRCLHLSSLIDAKGFPEYLEALGSLAGRPGPAIEAVLCGQLVASEFGVRFRNFAAAEKWIEDQLAELNSGGRVRAQWIRGAQGEKKQALFRAADIFVLPTRYAVEAQPLVLLEAMASGCAVITTGVGEIPTLLDERSAWMLRDSSAGEVAAAIESLVQDRARRASLAAAGHERYLATFARERHWDAWERLLSESRREGRVIVKRSLRLSFVFEYGGEKGDWMVSSLARALSDRLPGSQVDHIHGLIQTYRPGGLRPARLMNFAWVYLQTALRLVFVRTDAMIVRTSPPGIQLWAAWWAGFRGVPVVCWLMDYHPEIEARWLDERGLGPLARVIRAIDRGAMSRFAAVVALDPAMAAMARSQANSVEIVEHPTWAAAKAENCPVPPNSEEEGRPLNLVYTGNLGTSHPLRALEKFLESLVRRRPVRLFVVGSGPEAAARFRAMGARLRIPVDARGRVSNAELARLYREWRIDAGIVLLSKRSAGLVSPSKFSGYIDHGLPFLYIGPPGTNAAIICERFGGGFGLEEDASEQNVALVVDRLRDQPTMNEAAKGAREAALHFAGLNERTLAEALAPRLERCIGR